MLKIEENNAIVCISTYGEMTPNDKSLGKQNRKGITSMKNSGKTIARYRKEAKMNQTELAKELEKYDIRVKQNAVSQWESNVSQPSAKQLLAICEIFGIYDIYTDFIESNPINPFRNLNEKGVEKVQEYIHLLEKSGEYKTADIIPLHVIRERKTFPLKFSVVFCLES